MNAGLPAKGHSMKRRAIALPGLLHELFADESGQDSVEYALLAAIVGTASIVAWHVLATTVGDVYSAADSDVQSVSGCTPNPGGGGCS